MNSKTEQNEKWRRIPGWKHYRASNLGRIRSVDRVVEGRWASGYTVRGRVMKPRLGPNGHFSVSVTEDGVKTRRSVARLVAAAWLDFDMTDSSQIIIHENDNVSDNRPGNLQFGTAADLTDIRERRGTDLRGEDVGRSRLSREQVREILEACAAGASARGLARKYGMTKPTIDAIRDRTTWAHVEYGHRPKDAGPEGMLPQPAASSAQTGMVPYGFQRSACGCYTEPNHDERDAYRKMLRLRAQGESFGAIGRKLDHDGHRTRKGGCVSASSVHGVLRRYPTEADAPWNKGSQ